VTWVTGCVVTTSLFNTLLVWVPSVVVTVYVFVSTPFTPTVVTEDVPLARVALDTVTALKCTGVVSVTTFVVTTGVGVGVGVGVAFRLAVCAFFGAGGAWVADGEAATATAR
jgi:hypothetical protein